MKVLALTAMYPTEENPAWGSFIKTQVEALRAAGVDVEVMLLDAKIRKLAYLKGIFQLRKRLAKGDIDVVHAHFSYVGLVGRMQKSTPLVVTYHGSDILGAVKNDRGEHTAMSRYMVGWGQWLGRRTDAAIVQSKQMSGILDHADHVKIVPHEIDFDTFRVTQREEARKELGLHPEKPYLLFGAHPDNHVKRFPLADSAYKILKSEMPELELVVLHRETQKRLALYMSACDALVFPSFQEGSPNVVKQAMACNMPIVGTDAGDIVQVISNTDHCYVCEPNAEEIADKLRDILKTRPRTNGRENVQHFDEPIVTRQLIDVYELAIARKGGEANSNHSPTGSVGREATE